MKTRRIFLAIGLLSVTLSGRAQNAPVGIVSYQDSVRHAQVGIVATVASGAARGVQLSGFANMSASPFSGLQLSGISNIAAGVEQGVQWSGLLNVSSGYMRGAQLAAYNYADSLNGSQVGIINVALSHPKGWQVGLVNITRDTIAHKLGLVNVNPNTTIDYMIYGGTTTKGNAAVRFRNRSTYNIIGVGTHYMGLDRKFSGALFYRIGQYFRLSPHWTLSGDVGFAHIETFEHHNANSPQRLYSLQARLNADYRLTDRLGLFATVGYGDTRHYHHARHYRSRPLVEAGLTLRAPGHQQPEAHPQQPTPNRLSPLPLPSPDSLSLEGASQAPSGREGSNFSLHYENQEVGLSTPLPVREGQGGESVGGGFFGGPYLAAAEATGINVLVHCFDRFVMGEDFAKTTLRSVRHNIKNGFVWDNDQFSTNLFAHPYHGNLYFNAARSNGLSFWASAPYALGGSLMWEMAGEVEPPAINDLMATTVGGIAIGEITHRISELLLNDRSRGFSRFLREAAATVIDPMKGLNRIITGDAWRVRSRDSFGFEADFSLSVGDRYLADDGALFRGEHNPYVNLYIEYGDPLNGDEQNRPYDFFDAEVTFGLSSNQPIINSLHLLGRLWSTPMFEARGMKGEFGLYQHFNYYDSKPVRDGSDLTPYRISEAAAAGPGLIFSFNEIGSLTRIEQRVFLSGILLGGTKSDYYNVIDRDYNMGSGYSIKTKTHLEMRHFGRFILHARYFQLYTWKGYEQKNLQTVDPLYLNAQGDKGNARLLVVSPITEIDLHGGWSLRASASYFSRRTHYKHHPDVSANTFEAAAGLTFHF